MKGIFQTIEQRELFMESLGGFYAGLGGLFGVYREAESAFKDAKVHKIYRRAEIGASDFEPFSRGFEKFQSLRTAMQLEKAKMQRQMAECLENVNLSGTVTNGAKHYTELVGYQRD